MFENISEWLTDLAALLGVVSFVGGIAYKAIITPIKKKLDALDAVVRESKENGERIEAWTSNQQTDYDEHAKRDVKFQLAVKQMLLGLIKLGHNGTFQESYDQIDLLLTEQANQGKSHQKKKGEK